MSEKKVDYARISKDDTTFFPGYQRIDGCIYDTYGVVKGKENLLTGIVEWSGNPITYNSNLDVEFTRLKAVVDDLIIKVDEWMEAIN